jgi:hypothetical protein
VDGLAGLLIQFPQIRQAQAPDIKLPDGGLSNRETRDSEVMGSLSIAVQEACGDQIGQKAVNRAHWQPRQSRHLLRSESLRRFAKKMKQPQPTLKSGNVVIAFGTSVHRNWKNESAELSDENHFYAIPSSKAAEFLDCLHDGP